MAMDHGYGDLGLPLDQTKCIDLLRQSADLGCPESQYQLGVFHKFGKMGLQVNEEEAIKYTEKAAEGGDLDARHNLGCTENDNGNRTAATRHWRLSAAGGLQLSMDHLILYFERGFLHHGDLSETLQAFYRSRGEMKSKDRDQFIVHLKEIGEYEDEYQC